MTREVPFSDLDLLRGQRLGHVQLAEPESVAVVGGHGHLDVGRPVRHVRARGQGGRVDGGAEQEDAVGVGVGDLEGGVSAANFARSGPVITSSRNGMTTA
ncbi:hypothetical protein ABZW18_32325 [Streptomyces sp. NPDC004647]|uniref:hypothetical protein n=1 Tax=Streptomyces sp. NPDC004647 TaxID=3154671 RepID=UPI0033A90A12